MMVYEESFPCPLRAQFSEDLDFRTVQTPMQSGFILQRRWEPWIFRQLTLTYRMSVAEFELWWDWVHAYAYGWHTATIQGAERTIRYISDVSFPYRDFATVEASVRAEEKLPDEPGLWGGADPETYDANWNADLAADATGGATIDIDFRGVVGRVEVSVTDPPSDLVFATSARLSAITSIRAVTDAPLTIEIRDVTGATLVYSTTEKGFSWHHNTASQNTMLRLDPNTAYVLRLIGAPASFSLYGFTQ